MKCLTVCVTKAGSTEPKKSQHCRPSFLLRISRRMLFLYASHVVVFLSVSAANFKKEIFFVCLHNSGSFRNKSLTFFYYCDTETKNCGGTRIEENRGPEQKSFYPRGRIIRNDLQSRIKRAQLSAYTNWIQ